MYKQDNINETKSYSEKELIDKFKCNTNQVLKNPYIHCENKYLNDINTELILGNMSHENIIFVYFDSSILCKRKIKSMLEILNKHENKQKNKIIIMITCLTGIRENLYKLLNKEKYTKVNFDILTHNFKILKSKKSMHQTLYKTNIQALPELEFAFDYNAMYDLYFNDNQRWGQGHRNEINDMVQINILTHLLNFVPETKVCLFSDDINMIKKAYDTQSNFKIYTHINKKHHFELKKIDIDIQNI